jgi:cyclic pyranopterin phosphate synthase
VLADSSGRISTDLRVSVTDRCNLRCSYCMPAGGLDWLPGPALLTDDEVSRLISVAVRSLGVTEARFTGGEPLLRRGLPGLVAAAAALDPRPEISLTTNGTGLARLAGPLAAAGLNRLNVSLDTLSGETFRVLARRDRLPDVLAGLAAAADPGLAPVNVNAVLMRGVNDHEAPGLLGFCLDRGYQLRFIDQMPLERPARLAAHRHGHRRRDPRPPVRRVHPDPRPGRPGISPGRDIPGRRRPGPRRRDRLGHPAVLRNLRPGPSDG